MPFWQARQATFPPLAIAVTVSPTLVVRNLAAFTGGQDARAFRVVTSRDIAQARRTLLPSLLQSGQSAFTAQRTSGEALARPTCTPTVRTSHSPGEEAESVQVTVSVTCRAVVYAPSALQAAAVRMVSAHQATLSSHYRLLGAIQVTVQAATITDNADPAALLTTTIQGVWVYVLNETQLLSLIADQPRQQALRLLKQFPGVQQVSIAGVGDTGRVPADLRQIHLLLLVVEKDSLCQAFLGAIWSEEKNQCK
jgi:hypothetical protein